MSGNEKSDENDVEFVLVSSEIRHEPSENQEIMGTTKASVPYIQTSA